jgi:adenylate cyclase
MNNSQLAGKLTVILHADVAGSTLLVQQDEQRAHARVRDAFVRFGKIITRYHGAVRELRGDALLAEFERASDAVSAALAFQAGQGEFNAGLDDDIRPELRVGVALGEVIIADNTITGGGVVLAQRLEQIADPGGLCITPAIREALPKRLPFDLESLGACELKGFEDAIEVFRVRLRNGAELPQPGGVAARRGSRTPNRLSTGLAVAALVAVVLAVAAYLAFEQRAEISQREAAQNAADEAPSIAVLPFDNLSGDPQQDYFADGITEDLTTDLSRISGLFVVARNSSFAYKGRNLDLRTVAAELGVRYLLEGSVRRVGEQLRINAQLIDGASGGHLWADRFDGTMANVFQLQDEVNRKIVAALEVSLTAADKQRIDQVETVNPGAYDVLLRGNERYNVFTSEAVLEARELYRQAAEIDPGYARAYANIALTYATSVNFHWTDDHQEAIRLGLDYASKALALDDSIPQIYLTRSILYLSQRQHAAALEAAKRTIEVHPNYADGYATLAFIASYAGEFETGLDALQRVERINPQGTGVYLSVKGRILFLMKRYDEALPSLQEAARRNPAFYRNQLNLAATYAELGRIEDARWAVDEILLINPDLSLATERETNLYRYQSDLEHWLDALRKAGLPES